jgi:uncharacterized protein
MSETDLMRIAQALERLAPARLPLPSKSAPAYVWHDGALAVVEPFKPVALDLLTGIDSQKAAIVENGRRIAARLPAHDILLWGARGMGKSALVKSGVCALQQDGASLALVEVGTDSVATLPALFAILAVWRRPAIVFIDDLGFDDGVHQARLLRSILDGGAQARPDHVRIYVTSNRRHIVPRDMAEQDSAINPRDVIDDKLALADRFGLSLGFHACDQDTYLAMVAGYAAQIGVALDPADALLWATQRGARSGRVAWHYAVELAGRAGTHFGER